MQGKVRLDETTSTVTAHASREDCLSGERA
jgi:hypothetical protein